MMTRNRSFASTLTIVWALSAAVPAPASGQNDQRSRRSFVVGDLLAVWHQDTGTIVSYRGIPVFTSPPVEFVVHQGWTTIFHHAGYGDPERSWLRDEDGVTLVVRDRTAHFAYEKRTTLRPDGRLHVEYEYELLDPETAQLQVLWHLGRHWIHQSTYESLVDGEVRKGNLTCPATGRVHPWSSATRQAFTTDYGTFTLESQRGIALYAEPHHGVLWWQQSMRKGTTYTQVIDVRIEPGPAVESGVRLSDLTWTERVRTGRATFQCTLARADGGPDRVRVSAIPTDAVWPAESGEVVETRLSDASATVACSAPVDRGGVMEFALVVSDARTGAERLRISPLIVTSSPLLRAHPRLNLYTEETKAQLVVDIADDIDVTGCVVDCTANGVIVDAAATDHRVNLTIPLDRLAMGRTDVVCRLTRHGVMEAAARTTLQKAPPKANEVKIDNTSGGLIVEGLPFIPFGYYTYYPLAEGVMHEEVVRGFNLFSPYHGGPHDADARQPITEYMDRCAGIGLKVNYQLAWTNKPELSAGEWEQLRDEVEAFRDHPALLSWYIADEPPAACIETLEEVYRIIKELDPYHPVTIVFCRGAAHARKFANALDIVMADPYPVPNRPLTFVSETAAAMQRTYDRGKPLWIVPQCFGGNEGWSREPTAREQRVMTYLALIHGARGIKYFIRSPRTSFPKSPVLWAECGALALETAELTPALCSGEPAPAVTSSSPSIHVTALRDRGVISILAVNAENRPQMLTLRLEGLEYSGQADVLFEDRRIDVRDGAIEEPVEAYGTRAYALRVGPFPEDDVTIEQANLTVNPSWERNPSVGTPAGNYANVPPGASLFVDPRVARHGRHSLRLTAPTVEQTPGISHFPVRLDAGRTYRLSLWAKSRTGDVRLALSLGDLLGEELSLSAKWQEFRFTVTPTAGVGRASVGLALASAGQAWVDLLQIVPTE